MEPRYRPYAERTPDRQYLNLLRRIRDEGQEFIHPYQKVGRKTHLSLPPLVYRLKNGAPILTERSLPFWRKPISELIAFMNGATTLEELALYGDKETWASWWADWAYEDKCKIFGLKPGDLGPGSYGGAFGKFPTPEGKLFNQWVEVVRQMKEQPNLSTHFITSWIPFYTIGHSGLQRKVVVAPCHGNALKFTILNGKLTLRHVQRSADFPVGVPSNIIQYAAVTLMMAQVLNLEPDEYIHDFLDAQIYDNQVKQVEELLRREPRPFPTLRITDPTIKDILAFRPEHFELTDYHPHPGIRFPVTE